MNITVTVKDRTELASLIDKLRSKTPLYLTWTKRVADLIVDNIALKIGTGRFSRSLMDAVRVTRADDSGGTIDVQHAAAYHVEHGGVIRAAKAKYLTIPIHPRAKGFRARSFDLKIFRSADNKLYLVQDSDNDGVPESFYYRLVKQTRPQAPRPYLPSDAEVAQIGTEEAEAWLTM